MAKRHGKFGWLDLLSWAVALQLLAGLISTTGVSARETVATASPAAQGQAIRSITREDARQAIAQRYPFEVPQHTGGTLIDSTVGSFMTLNPILAADGGSFQVAGPVFDSLVGQDPSNGQPLPIGLTDWWDIAADGITHTLHLNHAATWHDGIDFTADDVAFSFDAIADEATGAGYTGYFHETIAGYRVIDPDTIEVTSNGIQATFLLSLGSFPIVAKHIWESVPHDQWTSDPGSTGQDLSRVVGTGPFILSEWVQGESITYQRNANSYDVVPTIDTYILRLFPDGTAAFNAMLAGEIDLYSALPEELETLRQTPDVELANFPTFGFTFYSFNLDPAKTPLFQEREVRQAFYYAIDRQSIVDELALGQGEVPRDIQPSISAFYVPEAMPIDYSYDPDKARQLLAQAGWSDTDGDGIVDRNGMPFRFTLTYGAGGDAFTERLVAYLQDAWRAIGIDVQPESVDFNVLLTVLDESHDFDMALLGVGGDPTGDSVVLFGCDQYHGGLNHMKYCNPRVDELYAQARRELDLAARITLFAEVDAIIWEDQPLGVVFFPFGLAAYSARVHNYFPGPLGNVGLPYVWVEA